MLLVAAVVISQFTRFFGTITGDPDLGTDTLLWAMCLSLGW